MTQPLLGSIGGTKTYVRYSGTAGGGAVIWSGPGRLNTVQIATRRDQSGLATAFVDFGGTFVSGLTGFAGPSGMTLVGRMVATHDTGVVWSGEAIDTTFGAATPLRFDVPFFSGLAFSDGSGTNPWTITFTPGKPLD